MRWERGFLSQLRVYMSMQILKFVHRPPRKTACNSGPCAADESVIEVAVEAAVERSDWGSRGVMGEVAVERHPGPPAVTSESIEA